MKGPVLEHVASAAVCLASKGCSLYDPDEQGVTATHGSSTPEAWLAGCLTSMPHPNVTPSGGAKWIPPFAENQNLLNPPRPSPPRCAASSGASGGSGTL